MDRRGQKLRFTAVSVFVVLALTGFSTGGGHGHGSSHRGDGDGGGGGGCSSSGQDHDSSSSSSAGTSGSRYNDYDDDDDTNNNTNDTDDTDDTDGDSGSSDASTTLQDASVKLVGCATPTQAYATVEVTSPNATGGYFTVTVDFLDAGSSRVEERSTDTYVAANETTTTQVDLSRPGVATKVDHCDPEPYAPAG